MVARKRLPSHRVERIDSLDGLTESGEDTGPRRAAARIGDIVVTKRYHPAVEESKAWLSTYHLGLIKELFGEGFVVEILDENNNPITVLGEKE